MPILDCETAEQTERSLAQLLGVSVAKVRDYVREGFCPALNQFYGTCDGATCWFHATRGREEWFLSSGILPLHQSIDRVWRLVQEILPPEITDEEWRRFRRTVESENYGHHADTFAAWSGCRGPYGFLVGEEPLLRPGRVNHDYLATSELADFIRPYVERKFGVDFRSLLRANTRSLLVKFRVKGISGRDTAGALDYLVHRARGRNFSFITPKYTAAGGLIAPEQIVKIIRVTERQAGNDRWEYSFANPP